MNTKKFYFITCAASFLIFFILFEYLLQSTYAQTTAIVRSGTALNIGWIFSLPYDISNTMRTPLGGPLSIILAGGLALIMMFGLFVAPVYYLFGTPERPYFYHDGVKEPIETIVSRSFRDDQGFITRFLESATFHNSSSENENKVVSETNSTVAEDYIPTFLQSAFFFLPEKNEQCKKLMVCHAHGFLGFMPEQVIRYYRFFSKKIPALPKTYQEAIILGLDDQGNCQITYDCPKDIAAIAKSTLFHIFPRHDKDRSPESDNETSSENFV